jgi:Xaa-Pro dipeptidase
MTRTIDLDGLTTADGRYPSFSAGEFERRHAAVRDILRAHDLGALVSYGSMGVHLEVLYLSNFPVAWEAVHILPLEGEPILLVQFHNHKPNATAMSNCTDVRLLGPDHAATVVPALEGLGLTGQRIGLAGRWPIQHHQRLRDGMPNSTFVDVSGQLAGLRLVKSAEELAFIRRGAELSDAALLAIAEHARPGMTEHELAAICEAAYLPHGGKNLIHFIGVTPMEDPDLAVPAQHHANRRIREGDLILTEISAQFHGHFGQTLRPLTVAADPTPEYQHMFDVALEAYELLSRTIRAGATVSEVREAAGIIEERGFLVHDDVVHGANGNWAPIIRTPSTEFAPWPEMSFVEDMTVVIQPNPISADGRRGMQVGDLVRVTRDGVERLHDHPVEFLRIG